MKRAENMKAEEVQQLSRQDKPSVEEGMYYERIFGPEKVRVMFNDKQELAKIVFEDKNGQSLEVSEPRLVSRVLMYYAKHTDFKKVAELRKLAPDVLQQALNTAIPKRNKEIKALYDDQGKLQGIASTMHEQISWAKVKQIIEGVISKVTGEVIKPEAKEALPFKWSYRVPVRNNNVSSWVGVHAGNNIIKGKSGIRVFSRFRTERQEGTGVKRPACLNWCGMWQFPQQFFNIDVKRLDNILNYVGADRVKDIEMFQFHIKPDMDQFSRDLEHGVGNMVEAMKKITPVINKSIHSRLSKAEMENILLAYQSRGNSYLPDYILKQILEHVEDETVWGFSQAVSYVRTHGDFKFTSSSHPMFKPVEDRDLTWRLENIAGEILSLTPTINDIHKKHGKITLEFLVGEDKAKDIRKEEQQAILVKAD
jgi:hypothetical protein